MKYVLKYVISLCFCCVAYSPPKAPASTSASTHELLPDWVTTTDLEARNSWAAQQGQFAGPVQEFFSSGTERLSSDDRAIQQLASAIGLKLKSNSTDMSDSQLLAGRCLENLIFHMTDSTENPEVQGIFQTPDRAVLAGVVNQTLQDSLGRERSDRVIMFCRTIIYTELQYALQNPQDYGR